MQRKEFLMLELDQQVNYINELMRAGHSLTAACKLIGISKSISEKFKSHGYELRNGQYVLKQLEGQQSLFNEPISPQEEEKPVGDTKVLPEAKKAPTEPIKEIEEPKRKVGRPQIHQKNEEGKKIGLKKLTIEIDKEVYKALYRYKIDEEFKINGFIEELLKKNIPEKYFSQ